MVTTRRSMNSNVNTYEQSPNGGIALLERPETTVNQVKAPVIEENLDEARARMQRNLDKLLNYDKTFDKIDEPVVEQVVEEKAVQEEDIRPTSTTMQFGDGDVDQMYKEMNRESEVVKESYHLNSKGKLVIVLYSLAVMVILALIAINTGMLATLSGQTEAKTAELNSKIAAYGVLQSEIDSISSNEYIINYAENQLNMIKR